MENENEKQLTEAELSAVKNSIAALCKKYIAGSFFDKLVDSSGIKIAKDILMSDLKEMIGHGTTAKAAEKFANAIQMAKSTPAVDTILANYMLKGDGMGTGIGYNESEEKKITPFKEFLAESRKAAENANTVEEKKEFTKEDINEAIEVAKAHGYNVITPEMINEAKSVAEDNGYKVVTKEEIEEAKKIVESKGFKVLEGKRLNESESSYLYIPVYDYDVDEVIDLIRFSLQNPDAPTFLRNKFGFVSFNANGSNVIVELLDSRDAAKSLRNLIAQYVDDNTGIEAEFDEDLLDNYPILLKKARIEEK